MAPTDDRQGKSFNYRYSGLSVKPALNQGCSVEEFQLQLPMTKGPLDINGSMALRVGSNLG